MFERKDINDMDMNEILEVNRNKNLTNVLCIGSARISNPNDKSNTLENQGLSIIEAAKREGNRLLNWKDIWKYISNDKIKQVLEDENISQEAPAIFIDRKSGKNFNRPFFQELIKIIELWNNDHPEDRIKICYVRNYDRLGRAEEYDSLMMIQHLEKKLGCMLWSCSESRDDFVRYVQIGMSKQERIKTANKIREGQVREFMKGKYIVQVPLGFEKKNSYDNKGKLIFQEIIDIPNEQKFIKKIFEEYLKDKNLNKIYTEMKNEGLALLKEKAQRDNTNYNAACSYNFFKKILSNTLYAGYQSMHIKSDGLNKWLYYKLSIEPLIDLETFYKINPELKGRMDKRIVLQRK